MLNNVTEQHEILYSRPISETSYINLGVISFLTIPFKFLLTLVKSGKLLLCLDIDKGEGFFLTFAIAEANEFKRSCGNLYK